MWTTSEQSPTRIEWGSREEKRESRGDQFNVKVSRITVTYPYHTDRNLAIQLSSRDSTWSLPRTNMTSTILGPI